MKNLQLLILLMICALISNAQIPQGFNLQMVIRDAGGAPIPSEQVQLRYTLLKDSISGTPVYQETQTKTSNQFGLINTVLGEGIVVFGNFASIQWYNSDFYLQQELDMLDGNGFMVMGTTQLISVPYAFVAGGIVLQSPDGTGYHVEVDSSGNLFTVPHLAPAVDFSVSSQSGYAPLGIAFTDQSINSPTSWQWDFGDGTNSSVQNPIHTYINAGDYTVGLTVSNAYGTDSEVKVDYIEVLTGSCPPTLTDIDGNTYNTVLIGTQCWMQENLNVTHYPNGDGIPYITDYDEWVALENNNTDDAYCYYNNNTGSEYGALYSYAAAIADNWSRDNNGGQGICPDGWHLPTDAEWTILSDYLGGSSVAGGEMKEEGTLHWTIPNIGATNESGFTALPGGYRSYSPGTFHSAGSYGDWWSATEVSSYGAWYRRLYYSNAGVGRDSNGKSQGISVRCLWD